MNINEYKTIINNATTKDELREISYKAFLEYDNALSGKKSLYDKIIDLCIKREEELS